jgi:hypothetical protein
MQAVIDLRQQRISDSRFHEKLLSGKIMSPNPRRKVVRLETLTKVSK